MKNKKKKGKKKKIVVHVRYDKSINLCIYTCTRACVHVCTQAYVPTFLPVNELITY